MRETFHKAMLSLALMAVLAASAFAQESEAEKSEQSDGGIKVGIRGGVHAMSMGVLDWSVGWHAGAVRDVLKIADMDIFGNLYLQPGLLFFTKNSIFDKQTYWLEVPVMLSWKYKIFRRTYRSSIGPYFNVGVFGDFEDAVESAFAKESASMNRFDAGLSVSQGSEWGWFWIGATVNMGFVSVSDYYDATAWSYRLTLGVNF